MKHYWVYLLLLVSLIVIEVGKHSRADEQLQPQVIRTSAAQSANDTAHSYFTALISLSLDLTEPEFGPAQLVVSTESITQGRWFRLLENSRYLDVVWAGAQPQRNRDYRAIPIDILGGILGVRSLIIRKGDRYKFTQIQTIEDLAKYTACQGQHWPDTDILKSAGLPVLTVNRFESNFLMLSKGRCDYFPRGIHEGYSEIEQYHVINGNDLVLFDDLLLAYPFNMFFYVDKANVDLAERLKLGLERAIDSGEILELMRRHPVTGHLFPLAKWHEPVLLQIDNPLHVEVSDGRPWWLLPSFGFYRALSWANNNPEISKNK
ncbi:hypothetical protein [Shewanella marisflavi]|uniref:Amino acid ABC transporter substrate-binding protein n=1 Tax=Shewanella marisflavi TaxID=260364 RepID=A0AAC9TZY2_9GAMM|nr:hypothetical protein [Shewanella marisflavi]ASJ96828.1 hypothetical protein CFF01_09680 [Shewanella marisflavi]